jgi:hypothetical protein
MKNHFTFATADECTAGIIFRPVLPQMILNADQSASSFMTLGKYGTGKTALKCEYFRTLSSNKYLKVSILNEQIIGYFDRFVVGMNVTASHCKTHNCLINWTENEFAQLLLSTLVTEFINTYDDLQYDGPDLSLDDKINLITIIFYYYNGLGTTQLQKFVNSLLDKGWFSKYQAKRKILEQNKYHNQQLLNHLKADLNKFSILDKDCERLHLLLIILEKEEFESQAGGKHLYGNTLQDLTQFSSFIKKYFKKTPVFVVDGIDEIKYFFQNNGINKAALESFCLSSISQSVLAIVTAHHFYLSLFYPKIDGINIEDTIILKDKFPTHTITWNTKSLINYADYVLQKMNKNASKTRCKAFPDFKTLVGYANEKSAKIIGQIPTPRALHHFISALMREMNNDASSVKNPFEATFENVDNAYRKLFETYDEKYIAEAEVCVGGSEGGFGCNP